MQQFERENTKVIEISNWKERKTQLKEKANYAEYLDLLGFAELMSEGNHLLGEIHHYEYTTEVSSKVRTLLKEFYNRLEKESSLLTKSLTEMRKKIELKINEG